MYLKNVINNNLILNIFSIDGNSAEITLIVITLSQKVKKISSARIY